MAGIASAVLPLALGGALLAGISSRGGTRPQLPGRRSTRRGARWATRRDLRPLVVKADLPPAGRLLLGVLPGVARLSGVAAETAQSVVVVGPTQSGKTTSLAVPAILGWRGPVVAASVKGDLLRHTRGDAARLGRVWCIDPTASSGAPGRRLVAADRLRAVAGGLPGGGGPVRRRQGRRDDGRRRVLVRHGRQAARPALPGGGTGPPHHGRRGALGRHAGGG